MNIAEFRKDLKKYFDLALDGEEVQIERGGLEYVLTVIPPRGFVKEVSTAKPILEKPDTTFNRAPVEFCKHGMVRGFCKQGCK
jgi:hypothetical protein